MSESIVQFHPATYWIKDRRKPQESWQEVSLHTYCAHERAAGFRPKCGTANVASTSSFSSTRYHIEGRVSYEHAPSLKTFLFAKQAEMAEHMEQMSKEVRGKSVRILSGFNGQPHGNSRPSLRGTIQKVLRLTVDVSLGSQQTWLSADLALAGG